MTSAPQSAMTVMVGNIFHAPKNTVASPTKFAKPGSPQPAIAAINNAVPMNGSLRQRPPSSLICNVPVCVDQQCNWIADALGFVRARGLKSIQPSAAIEDEWMAHHEAVSEPTLLGQNRQSWYRRKGPDGSDRELLAYMGGIPRYREYCDRYSASSYEGFNVT